MNNYKRTYVAIGEILHSFNEFIKQKNFKYVELINELGRYIRFMYRDEVPLSFYEKFIEPDSCIDFPCLNKLENAMLKKFLREIHEGTYEPAILIELCNELMFNSNFEDALNKTVKINNFEHGNKKDSCQN